MCLVAPSLYYITDTTHIHKKLFKHFYGSTSIVSIVCNRTQIATATYIQQTHHSDNFLLRIYLDQLFQFQWLTMISSQNFLASPLSMAVLLVHCCCRDNIFWDTTQVQYQIYCMHIFVSNLLICLRPFLYLLTIYLFFKKYLVFQLNSCRSLFSFARIKNIYLSKWRTWFYRLELTVIERCNKRL